MDLKRVRMADKVISCVDCISLDVNDFGMDDENEIYYDAEM